MRIHENTLLFAKIAQKEIGFTYGECAFFINFFHPLDRRAGEWYSACIKIQPHVGVLQRLIEARRVKSSLPMGGLPESGQGERGRRRRGNRPEAVSRWAVGEDPPDCHIKDVECYHGPQFVSTHVRP